MFCFVLKILLITSHRDPTSWIIPGGGVEPNENVHDAANRELYEEAGVKGRIVRDLGVFDNNERKHRTTVFVVYFEEEYDDWEDKRLVNRQRHWYSLNETIDIVQRSKPSQIPFLQKFLQTSPRQSNFHHQLCLTKH